jgi:hypothetical protein
MKFRRRSRGAGAWVQNILGGLITSALWTLLVDAYDWLAKEHIRWYPSGETWPHALSAFLAGGGWHAPALQSALCAAWATGMYIENETENKPPEFPSPGPALLAQRSLALLASLFVVGMTAAFITRTFINWIAGRPLLTDPGVNGWIMLLIVFMGTGIVEWWPHGGRTGGSRSEDGNELPEARPRS